MVDAIAEDQIDPSHQLRLVLYVMAGFGVLFPLHASLDELAIDRLSMIDRLGGFLFRILLQPVFPQDSFHLHNLPNSSSSLTLSIQMAPITRFIAPLALAAPTASNAPAVPRRPAGVRRSRTSALLPTYSNAATVSPSPVELAR